LRHLPLFNLLSATSNFTGRLPKPLYTHGKHETKKTG
jgi:hypothetical protein